MDEYRLVVHPVAIGSGTPFFPRLATPLQPAPGRGQAVRRGRPRPDLRPRLSLPDIAAAPVADERVGQGQRRRRRRAQDEDPAVVVLGPLGAGPRRGRTSARARPPSRGGGRTPGRSSTARRARTAAGGYLAAARTTIDPKPRRSNAGSVATASRYPVRSTRSPASSRRATTDACDTIDPSTSASQCIPPMPCAKSSSVNPPSGQAAESSACSADSSGAVSSAVGQLAKDGALR